ncbi:uncharacterized protein MELLADRAFT_117192 [Melampsora larici-populina 98AG31]|uniref:SH3 domain-containing protein n=1 Tax=Melampsora larici-populina (strain 98AG31 / pathotype 3-4-7) TaxID=747676 RepID=F4RUG6_MELLP|nr:uncharacterized protein MELLADRAFT_117192 [Melampsora larici-populina 98AG31]EGG03930.1 hypothetical protein MELLADRAFT_117192 [Melampsora larici-populina 98AG31]
MSSTTSQKPIQSDDQEPQYYYSGNQRYTSVASQVTKSVELGQNSHSDEDDHADEDEDDEDDELYMTDAHSALQHQQQQQLIQQRQQQQLNQQRQQQQAAQSQSNDPQETTNGMEIDDEGDRASDSSFSDSVSMSSSPSIPSSDDIDFTLVYALHTFLATVDGQASVVKGDQLTLLDDSNSYWWLIRVLKTQAVGYIPAENIETPFERLARLNKHRNVDLSSATPNDHISGPGSSLAQTRFALRIPSAGDPVRSRSPQDARKGPLPPAMPGPGTFSPPPVAPAPGTGKGKTVAFTAPTYFENSGNEWSDDGAGETGDEEMSGDEEEGEEGDWDGEGEFGEEGEEGFEDEEEETEDEDEDEQEGTICTTDTSRSQLGPEIISGRKGDRQGPDAQRQLEDQLTQEHKQQAQLRQQHQQHSTQDSQTDESSKGTGTSGWARLRLAAKASADSLRGANSHKDDGRSQLGKGISPAQRGQIDTSESRDVTPQQTNRLNIISTAVTSDTTAASIQPSASTPQSKQTTQNLQKKMMKAFEEAVPDDDLKLNPNSLVSGETKKLTLTPDIARDSQESQHVDAQSIPSNIPHLTRQRSTSGSTSEASTSLRRFTPTDPRIHEEDEQPIASIEGPRAQSIASIASNDSLGGSEDGKSGFGKRLASKKDKREDEPDGKKKKGLLSGLFGRKKDKKTAKSTNEHSDEAERVTSSSPSSLSDQSMNSMNSPPIEGNLASASGPNRRMRAGTSDLFSTDAALKKQQVEAQEVMYRQYGISRTPSDSANSTTFSGKNPALQISASQPMQPSSQAVPVGPLSPLSPIGSLNGLGSPPFATSQRLRPGSLIGSPSVPGMEVPMLNVLRIFAGENVDAEATFKTVLLSEQTTTTELIVQAMQRFHLPSDPEYQSSYYLTIKDVVSGEENKIDESQLPLKVFEAMNEAMGQDSLLLPSVKRSSVGSISSISSNLSLNPAISRLGMSDFSDDSAVKFYINSYGTEKEKVIPKTKPLSSRKNDRAGVLEPIQEDMAVSGGTDDNASDKGTIIADGAIRSEPVDSRLSQTSNSSSSSSSTTVEQGQSILSPMASPSLRFAMRIQIYPNDLPDGVVFDPQSNAIIPKIVLNERGKRNSSNSSASSYSAVSLTMREKIMLFPRNINVSEAIEHTLDAFGISEGVVDGGDDVEEKVKAAVPLISKVLDAYLTPPAFRPPDRSSKESRRRSQEGSFVFGSLQDILNTDPVFVLRRASHQHHPTRRESNRSSTGLAGAVADELGLMGAKKSASGASNRLSGSSSRPGGATTSLTRHNGSPAEMMADRRAAFLSATPNSDQGVDITLNDHATIRSKRDSSGKSFRYSYIDPAGTEFDISELIESEWSPTPHLTPAAQTRTTEDVRARVVEKRRQLSRQNGSSSQNSLSSMTDDGYASAPESPVMADSRVESPTTFNKHEDEQAIEALRLAPLTIDQAGSSGNPNLSTLNDTNEAGQPITRDNKRQDLLMAALDKRNLSAVALSQMPDESKDSPTPGCPPINVESLEKRIERVLAKVKTNRQISSKTRSSHSRKSSSISSWTDHNANSTVAPAKSLDNKTPSENANLASSRSRLSPTRNVYSPSGGSTTDAPKAPNAVGLDHSRAPSIDQILSSQEAAQTQSQVLQASINSSRSNSTTGTNSPVTPVTATSPTGDSTYTPISSATRGVGIDSRQSTHRHPLLYRDDFGLDVLMNLINYSAFPQGNSTIGHMRDRAARSTPINEVGTRVKTHPIKTDGTVNGISTEEVVKEDEAESQMMKELFGPIQNIEEDPSISNEIKSWYQSPSSSQSRSDHEVIGPDESGSGRSKQTISESFNVLEDRLDQLMRDVMNNA